MNLIKVHGFEFYILSIYIFLPYIIYKGKQPIAPTKSASMNIAECI